MRNNLTTSDNFTALMISFEKEVLKGYLDPVGIPTIGIGHVIRKGEPYKVGQSITREESRRLFKNDTAWAINAVNRFVKRPLNQNQFDALVSLVFNIGEKGFSRSTVLRETNRGNFKKAADAFLLWNKAKGKVLKGLIRRRQAEAKLFLTPVANKKNPTDQTESLKSETLSDDISDSFLEEKTDGFQDDLSDQKSSARTIEFLPADGSTGIVIKLTIAGLTVPPAVAALVKIVQDIIASGFIDAKTVGDSIISFLNGNYKYVFVSIGFLIVFLIVKKLLKQITLWLEMFFIASKDYNDVRINKDA